MAATQCQHVAVRRPAKNPELVLLTNKSRPALRLVCWFPTCPNKRFHLVYDIRGKKIK
jgi:hypothetical protein